MSRDPYRDEPGNDDVFWWRCEKSAAYCEYAEVRDALHARGLAFFYGGKKGHGFWVEAWADKPDGGDTGNRRFFSMRECRERLAPE